MQVCVKHTPGKWSLNATSLPPIWVLFATSESEDPKRRIRGQVLGFRGRSEVQPRFYIGSIEVVPRWQRGQIEKKCQTSPDSDHSSPHFPQIVPKTGGFPRKIYQTSHHFEELVTSLSEHHPIFEKAEGELMYICAISYYCSEFRSGLTGSANPETLSLATIGKAL